MRFHCDSRMQLYFEWVQILMKLDAFDGSSSLVKLIYIPAVILVNSLSKSSFF